MPQTNEWLLYRASGQLPRGFQGHISYTTLLPGELRALRVVFTFDKREPQQEPDTLLSLIHISLSCLSFEALCGKPAPRSPHQNTPSSDKKK